MCPVEPSPPWFAPVECSRDSDCAGDKICCPSTNPYYCEDGVDPTPRAGKLIISIINVLKINDW